MSRCITICPIGPVDDKIIEYIAERISARCGLESRVSDGMKNPEYAYNEVRRQYDSKVILKRLIQSCPHDTLRLMGVTHVDLYVTILKYVFGLAQIEGQCSLISTHRLRPEFYDQPSNPDLLLSRVEKTAVHELGHTLGLTHCMDKRCVMSSSTRIENTDRKGPDYCPTCLDLFNWYLDKQLPHISP